ncbi:sensor histidine kinase [Halarchaeum sp. P4]|uniref:sensor histidine kinase n=1 Tax=Halarchaeum sp. P4 TaxID=3421639 RepID=UPI003EBCA386
MAGTLREGAAKGGFYALGSLCLGVAVVHLLTEGEGIGTTFEAVLIGGLSTIVLYTGYRLPSRAISEAGGQRAVYLSVGVAGAFAALAFAVWTAWYLEGDPVDLSFLLSFASVLGAAVGSRVGVYAIESDEQLTQARELATLLRINQRILRHNLRNDLTVALGYLDRLENEEDIERGEAIQIIRDRLEDLNQVGERGQRIISIWEVETTREFDLTTVVREEVATFRTEYPETDVSVDTPEECRVDAHPALPTAVQEALTNAVEHNEPDVSLSVRVEHDGDTATIEIADTGKGIPQSDSGAITLGEETSLTHPEGLGLWLIYWIVRKSDGHIELAGTSSGTLVRITLPATSRERWF